MNLLLKQLGRSHMALVNKVIQLADEEKIQAYLVGGIVRDLFLKRKNLDLDIVLEADAVIFAKKLAKELGCPVQVYEQFKTATLVIGEKRLDLASARKESYLYPGALPVVSFGKIYDDLLRRDFTINALALYLNGPSRGQCVDFFNGRADLKNKTIRILHDKSFEDDPTRLLRAVRFEERFYFRMDSRTRALFKGAMAQNYPATVKAPRYFSEFSKILKEKKPLAALKRLNAFKGLRFIANPLVVAWNDVARLEQSIPLLENKAGYKIFKAWWQLYLFAVLRNAPSSQLDRIFSQWQLPQSLKKSILEIQGKSDIINLSSKRVSPGQAARYLKSLSLEALIYLRATASNRAVAMRIDRFVLIDSKINLAITGHDLIRLGVGNKLFIPFVLEAIREEKINRKIKTAAQEQLLAKKIISEHRYGKT